MVAFQQVEYFLMLAAIPLLLAGYFFLLNWKKKTAKKIGDVNLVKEITKNFSPRKFTIKFVLVLCAIIAGVFALVNLRSPKGIELVNRDGIDIMIVLDVSKSMLAQDIKPTRLDRAKQALSKLIDKLNNDRIGIVVFAGRAYLQMPLTGDHAAAKMYLSAASTEIVPTQGTVIADALTMCYSSFNAKEKKYKAVVLISDGEDHDEGALKVAGRMAEDGITIFTIGIGSPRGATIIDELTNNVKKDVNGNTVITKLNETELIKIAEKGKGSYALFTNTENMVTRLDAQLGSMDQRTVTEDSLVNYKNYFPYFLAFALVLLVIELLFSERRSERGLLIAGHKRRIKLKPLLPVVFSSLPFLSFSQTEKQLIKQGNDAYRKQEYSAAIDNYQKAISKKPSDATAQYNLGNALYKTKKTEEAVQAYESALANTSSKADRSNSFYNKGVVLQHNKKLAECIEAYKNALKLNPQDEDARQNLQKALQQQKQKQQKEEKETKDKKESPKEKKQKQKEEEKNKQPKPRPSKLTRQDAEEKLKALLQQEKNLQDRLRKVNAAAAAKPEKDW